MHKIAFLILHITMTVTANAARDTEFSGAMNEINNFVTDGCSMYPDSGLRNSWVHCCIVHDVAYWKGGTKKARLVADLELRRCISEETSKAHGLIVYRGVRAGGLPDTGLRWRWAYGFDGKRGYKDFKVQGLKKASKLQRLKIQELKVQETETAINKFDGINEEIYNFAPNLTQEQEAYISKGLEFHKTILKESLTQIQRALLPTEELERLLDLSDEQLIEYALSNEIGACELSNAPFNIGDRYVLNTGLRAVGPMPSVSIAAKTLRQFLNSDYCSYY